jgi:tetratricopeptide (TPR) repeat protein
LPLLEKASLLSPDGFLRDDIDIDLSYCLQAVGRLDEAKGYIKSISDREPEKIIVDAYYRLGSVQFQAEEYEAAIDSLQRALSHLPHGKIAESDILTALREAKEQQSMNPIDRPPTKSPPKPQVQ